MSSEGNAHCAKMHVIPYIAAVSVIFLEIFYPHSVVSGVVVCATALLHLTSECLQCAAGDDVAEHVTHHCKDWPGLVAGDIAFVVALVLGVVAIIEPMRQVALAGAGGLTVGNGFYTYKDCTQEPDVRPELRHYLVEV